MFFVRDLGRSLILWELTTVTSAEVQICVFDWGIFR